MSYVRTRARRNFESQLTLMAKELPALYKVARKAGCGERLLAAYYVFAYSQIEVYIKSIVEDSIDALNNIHPSVDKLPDLLLGYHLHKSENLAMDYRRFHQDEDEGPILEKVAQIARKIGGWSTGTVDLTAVHANSILEKKKYPSPKNLPKLFRRLGIKHLWAAVNKAGKFNGELVLTSLNDLRTGIAHEGEVPPGFSLGDIRERLDKMRIFVAALDRGISAHFCSTMMSRSDWNNALR